MTEFGEQAWDVVSRCTGQILRADELPEARDMEGRAASLRVLSAAKELLSKERPADAKVH